MKPLSDFLAGRNLRIYHGPELRGLADQIDNWLISQYEDRDEHYVHASKLSGCPLSIYEYVTGNRGETVTTGRWERTKRGGHFFQEMFEAALAHEIGARFLSRKLWIIDREIPLDHERMIPALGRSQPFPAKDFGIAGTVDNILVDEHGVRYLGEWKTCTKDDWSELGTGNQRDKLSYKWYIQVQVYLACTDLPHGLVFAVNRDSFALECFYIEQDAEVQDYLLERASTLYYEHIRRGVAPEPEPSSGNCLFCSFKKSCAYSKANDTAFARILQGKIIKRSLPILLPSVARRYTNPHYCDEETYGDSIAA